MPREMSVTPPARYGLEYPVRMEQRAKDSSTKGTENAISNASQRLLSTFYAVTSVNRLTN